MRNALLAGIALGWSLAAQTAPNQGSIEGQILNASSGAPLKKVTVRLSGMFAPSTDPTRVGNQMKGQDTDDQGRFQFTGLPPGQYQLSAQRTGFLPQNYGARRANAAGTRIAVGRDQHVTDIAMRLTPQGVIVGRVVDEDGDPVAYAQVMVFRQMYRNGKKQWTQSNGGNTSDIGEYRVPSLEPGRYLVVAASRPLFFDSGPDESLPRKPELIYAATYYPNGLTEQAAAPVDVAAGAETRGIEIHLTKVPAYRVRGTVNGIPQGVRGGTSVNLFHKDGSYNSLSNAQVQGPANQFELRNVTPGLYTLYVRSGGAQPMTATQTVAVGADHVTGLVLTLAPALDVPGQVRVAETGVTVSLKNVSVTVRPPDLVFLSGPITAQSDAEGRLVLKNLSPGQYVADVMNLPDGCFVQTIKFGGQAVTPDGVEISSASPLEVVLSATAAKIGGSVVDKDGKPVPGARVVLIPGEAGARTVSAAASDTGTFTFGHLKPGTYRLLAWEDVEPDAWEDPEFRKPFDSLATEIQVGPSEQQNVQLHAVPAEGNLP
jgi:protocatechuate 3,4-dioxygenase beta subunit